MTNGMPGCYSLDHASDCLLAISGTLVGQDLKVLILYKGHSRDRRGIFRPFWPTKRARFPV